MVRQNQTLLNRSIAALRSKRLRHLGIGEGFARFENHQNLNTVSVCKLPMTRRGGGEKINDHLFSGSFRLTPRDR
jgi:hypothetical protein